MRGLAQPVWHHSNHWALFLWQIQRHHSATSPLCYCALDCYEKPFPTRLEPQQSLGHIILLFPVRLPWWDTMDAEINVYSPLQTHNFHYSPPFTVWSRLEYSRECFTYCQQLFLFYCLPSGSFILIFPALGTRNKKYKTSDSEFCLKIFGRYCIEFINRVFFPSFSALNHPTCKCKTSG